MRSKVDLETENSLSSCLERGFDPKTKKRKKDGESLPEERKSLRV